MIHRSAARNTTAHLPPLPQVIIKGATFYTAVFVGAYGACGFAMVRLVLEARGPSKHVRLQCSFELIPTNGFQLAPNEWD